MAVNEVIKKSAYRVWNELEAVWKKYALWTTGEQVECTDGQSVEDKIGAVKGVTTSTNVEEEGWIPDATLVTELSRNMGGVTFIENPTIDEVVQDGLYYRGADAVLKKLGKGELTFKVLASKTGTADFSANTATATASYSYASTEYDYIIIAGSSCHVLLTNSTFTRLTVSSTPTVSFSGDGDQIIKASGVIVVQNPGTGTCKATSSISASTGQTGKLGAMLKVIGVKIE